MFYSISGKLVTMETAAAVIDNNGIAYYLQISGTTHARLASKLGAEAKLYTYLGVKEDGIDLFGFYTLEELNTFKLLISVSGVGPKAAMSILSMLTPEKFAMAVGTGNEKALKAPGVGPKIAARIVLELKDKVAREMSVSDAALGESVTLAVGTNIDEAVNALMVLGYTRGEAAAALKGLTADMSIEELITAALKKLAKS